MVAPVQRTAIGLDVGGTKLAGALVTDDGTVLAELVRPCPRTAAGRDPGLGGTLALAEAMVALAAERDLRPEALGAGFPEYVDARGRLGSHEVLAWETQPADLLTGLGLPVTIDADVRCGAVAEARLGAGRGHASALYVSVGTGLSSTLVVDGVPLAGARGEAIALGELDSPDGVGRLEPRCAGAGIAAAYAAASGGAGAEVAAASGRPEGSGAASGRAQVTEAREVLTLAAAGDDAALALLHAAGCALGAALGAVVALLDPHVVVLGGGLGTATGTPYAEALDAAYAARSAERPGAPPLVRATLGARSGVVGAALRALD